MENQRKTKSQLLREIEELERWIDELTSGSFDCICREKWIKIHENNLQTILDSVPAYIFYKDINLRYIHVNESLAEASGIPVEQWIGKTTSEIFPSLPTYYTQEEKEVLLNGTAKRNCIELFPFIDGTKWLHTDKLPYRADDGKIIGVVGISIEITETKLAENALKESEERYKALFERSLDCVYIHDFTGNFLDANSTTLELLGYQKNEFINHNFSAILAPDHVTYAFSIIEKLKQEGVQKQPVQLKLKHRNGRDIYVESKSSIIYKNGKPYAIQGIARDITKKTKAEGALRKSEFLFRSVWENSIDGMRLLDENGTILMVNEAFCKMFDKKREELEGRPLSVIYEVANSKNIINKAIHNFSERNIKPYFEKELMLWNGKKAWFSLTNNFIDSADNPLLLLSIFRNINERKLHETELETERDLIKSIFDSSPDAIAICNARAQIIDCNLVTLKFLGCSSKEEVIGKQVVDLLSGMDKARAREDLKRTLRVGSLKDSEYKFMNSKQEEIFVQISANLLKDTSGNPLCIVGIAKDITKRKLADEQQRKYSEDLQELNASKDKFFSIISHDLKSPFQGLLGISELLVSEGESLSKEEVLLLASAINKSLKNQLKLLDNLLQWSRIQTGKMVYIPGKLDLHNLVDDVVLLLMSNAINKGIVLSNDVRKGKYVFADLTMISSVIQNLMSNAIKFTTKGGEIRISSEEKDDYMEIYISDTGIGIKKEDQKKLFRIDYHHTTPGTENETGTGLGLILCKEMIEMNGGKIRIESQVGVGTSFIFTLPIYVNNNRNGKKRSL